MHTVSLSTQAYVRQNQKPACIDHIMRDYKFPVQACIPQENLWTILPYHEIIDLAYLLTIIAFIVLAMYWPPTYYEIP